jgi:hypothetical protein
MAFWNFKAIEIVKRSVVAKVQEGRERERNS